MCNLYRLDTSPRDIAAEFRADCHDDLTIPAEIARGSIGAVIANGTFRHMHWGLPTRLNRHGTPRFDPLAMNTNLDEDRDSWIGRDSFIHRRCLVPMNAFAEHDGILGTPAWFATPGSTLFACAGIWRDTLQAGPVFTLVMSERDPTGHRWPIVLSPVQFFPWLFGRTAEAEAICASAPLVDLEPLGAGGIAIPATVSA